MTDNNSAVRSARYILLVIATLMLAVAGYGGYVLYPRFGLSSEEGASLLLLAVAAGVASFFSPCSFPLLVTLLARQSGVEQDQANARILVRSLSFALALAVGASVFLLSVGVVLALSGEAILAGITFASIPGRALRIVVGIALIGLGFIQLGRLRVRFDVVGQFAKRLMQSQARQRQSRPLLGFAILGFGYPLAGFG